MEGIVNVEFRIIAVEIVLTIKIWSTYYIYLPSPYFNIHASIYLPELTSGVIVITVDLSLIYVASDTVKTVLTSLISKPIYKN